MAANVAHLTATGTAQPLRLGQEDLHYVGMVYGVLCMEGDEAPKFRGEVGLIVSAYELSVLYERIERTTEDLVQQVLF